MNRIRSLFEEDINLQDTIENLDGMTDDSEDLIIGVIEDRYKDDKPHLFVNDVPVDEAAEENITKLLTDDDDMKEEDYEDFLDDDF